MKMSGPQYRGNLITCGPSGQLEKTIRQIDSNYKELEASSVFGIASKDIRISCGLIVLFVFFLYFCKINLDVTVSEYRQCFLILCVILLLYQDKSDTENEIFESFTK